jgi:MoxR-like ATPase
VTQHVDLERSDGPGSTAATAEHRPTDLAQVADVGSRIAAAISQVVLGKAEVIRLAIVAVLSEGHLLIEDVPGTGKTVLAKALAKSVDSTVSRVQFTPDLMPSDVTGVSVYDRQTSRFEFRAGPIFANVVLVDEINRAMPRTQSALLEAMAEHQITADGETRPLPIPFLILATQNPLDHEGTFPLPEAQLDRFFMRTTLGYPDAGDELRIVQAQRHAHPLSTLETAITADELRDVQEAVEAVYIDPGASVRGSLALERGARAWALLKGRAHVEPADVETLFQPVLGHRVVVNPYKTDEATNGHRQRTLLERCLARAPRPAFDWAAPE